ncbi:hypothetical protein CIB84_003097 [Bambusicola thoracicus]|uniref:Uncharacterized protein n=1 Tax=Bambusicola thoracicus TaxID=9083 RepID=A0A2P4T9W1_BAMTH|nr:hypothetical protein CIB84_003097 [Bambusicola thoracicus]
MIHTMGSTISLSLGWCQAVLSSMSQQPVLINFTFYFKP